MNDIAVNLVELTELLKSIFAKNRETIATLHETVRVLEEKLARQGDWEASALGNAAALRALQARFDKLARAHSWCPSGGHLDDMGV